jgi:hypothetical protein
VKRKMARYIPTWQEIDYLAKAGDMANEAYARGDHETARRLDDLAERVRRGERHVVDQMEDLTQRTYTRIFGND